jgi:hypothetical protein
MGFISHMHGSLHNRDRINDIIQKAMKTNFPEEIEVKMVPTPSFKHGLKAKQHVTHVVSIQAARKHLNEAREALVATRRIPT